LQLWIPGFADKGFATVSVTEVAFTKPALQSWRYLPAAINRQAFLAPGQGAEQLLK